jgi:RND family efflux transporter MFP subunit
MIAAANAKIEQTTSELDAHYAHVHTAEAGIATARRRIEAAQAGVRQARASLAGSTTTRGYSEIRALVDGAITQRVISPGVLVNPGQVILKVAQIHPIRLQANVSEADLKQVRVGSRVRVQGQGDNGKPVEAHVTSITPAVDPVARTGVVEAVIPNQDSQFLPGQFVEMEISTGRSSGTLRVPSRAVRWHTPASGEVLSTQPSPYVWVAEPAGAGEAGGGEEFTALPVEVRTGRSDGSMTEILSGLKEGQQVIVAGHQDLKSGDAVTLIVTRSVKYGAWSVEKPHQPLHAPRSTLNAQRYSCPMHPEVVHDGPGECPQCGMDLVPQKSAAPSGAPSQQYTCPMDPEVVSDKPGDCPKCGMDLVKKEGRDE